MEFNYIDYQLTDKEYHIIFKHKYDGSRKTLVYRFVDSPIVDLFLGRVRSVMSKEKWAIFKNQWSTYTPSLEKINAIWKIMYDLVQEANSKKYVDIDYISMPKSFDPAVQQQPLLNHLHYEFHRFEEEVESEPHRRIDWSYDPLMRLNVEIHTLEALMSIYDERYDADPNRALIACGFLLHSGHPDKVSIEDTELYKHWHYPNEFGDMVLGYHTVGKNTMHCYQDNDVALVKKGMVRPQKFIGPETMLMFRGWPRDVKETAMTVTAMHKWVKDNKLESYVDMSLPENTTPGAPLLAKLQGTYTREEISDLFFYHTVETVELKE